MFATEVIVLIVLILLNLALGVFAFIKNPERKTNIYFLMVTISIVVWIISIFMLINYSVFNIFPTAFLGRLPFVTIIFFAWTLVYFSYHFPLERKIPKLLHYVINFSSIAAVLLTSGPFVIKDITIVNGLPFPVYGSFLILFVVYFLGFIFWALVILSKKFRKATGIQRTQIRFLFIGFALTIFVGTGTNLFLPLLFDNLIVYQLGPYSTLAFIFLTSYSMIRLRLFDMRIKFQEILNYTLPFFIVLPISIVVITFLYRYSDQAPALIGSFILIFSSILYKILYDKISSTYIGHYLFRSTYLYQKALLNLSRDASTILDLNILGEKIIAVFHEDMNIEDVVIVVGNTSKKYKVLKKCCTGNIENRRGLAVLPKEVKKFLDENEGPLIREEVRLLIEYADKEEKERYKKPFEYLDRLGLEVCLPLYLQESLIGYVLLGEKDGNGNYTEEDISLFKQTSKNLASAFANSILHETKEKRSRLLQDEVEEQTKEIKDLYEMKSNFLTVASHQLRTPTSIIRGMLSMLVEDGTPPEKKDEMIEAAFKSSSSLERVIDDILTAAEIDSARFDFEPESVDIIPITKRIVEELQLKAEKKKLNLVFEEPRAKSIFAMTNKSKVEQAFVNLIDNALNYTAKGTITVQIKNETVKGKKYIAFSCTDTGVGMTKADMRKIGEKFFRSKNVFSVHPNGTGLGIYIVKQVVRASKGKLVLESDGLGKGSTFKILLHKANKPKK